MNNKSEVDISQMVDAFECIGDGVILVDLDGKINYMNSTAEKLTGWNIEDAIEVEIDKVFSLINAVTSETRLNPVKETLITNSSVGLKSNTALISKNGDQNYVSANYSPIKDTASNITGVVIVFRDISRIKKTEERIKNEHDNLLLYFENNPMSILIIDEDFVIQQVNSTFLKEFDKSIYKVINFKFGDSINCINSFPAGCGNGEECKHCAVRHAIKDTFEKFKPFVGETVPQTLLIESKPVLHHHKISYVPIIIEGEKHLMIIIDDKTEKIKAEDIINRANEYYRELFENIPVMFWHTDIIGKLDFINENLLDYIGELHDQLFLDKIDLLNYIHCEDFEKILQIYLDSFKNNTSFEVEFRVKFKDNTYRWVKCIGKPYINLIGKYAGYSGAVFDINEQKQLELTLKESRDFYISMFDNFPALVWRSNTDKKADYFNKAWLELTGNTLADEINTSWSSKFHTEDLEKLSQIWYGPLDEPHSSEIEYRLKRYDGEYRWIRDKMGPIFDMKGNFTGYIGVCWDITEEKLATEGLERYRILSEKAIDIILFVDMNGNIIEANNAALNAYGYKSDELLNRSIFEISKDFTLTEEMIEEALAKGISFEDMNYRKDGTSFPVETKFQSVIIGKKQFFMSVSRDITKMKKAHQEVIQAKEIAEAANKAKSEFLANMSHEIRTPLNGIVGMIDLSLLSDLNEELSENLMTAKNCVDSLLKIINDILDFSKMEAGKLTIQNENFEFREMIDETLKIHMLNVNKKGLKLVTLIAQDIPKILNGDIFRIKQIINNLINNAVKFTQAGEISLSAKVLNFVVNHVVLEFVVSDTGTGIPPEDMNKLFKVFSQVDGSYTRKFGGTGLGLSICKQLVGIMGGDIWAESELGKGSSFHFVIPLGIGDKPVEEVMSTPKEIKAKIGNDVLLVDDDLVNQKVLSRILKMKGHRVKIANNGVEALDLQSRNHFDFILMDIQMPRMNGIEATKQIRGNKGKNQNTPIIALTAFALQGDRERFLELGMDAYVSKPINMEELFECIDRILKKNSNSMCDFNKRVEISEKGEIVFADVENIKSKDEIQPILTKLQDDINKLTSVNNIYNFGIMESISHEVKNLFNEIGAEEMKDSAFKIELAARRNNLNDLIENTSQMEYKFDVFMKSLI
jgi:PAS domain S-box-containing protein